MLISVSLAAGGSSTVDPRREILERATFGCRRIKRLFCIQERRDGSLESIPLESENTPHVWTLRLTGGEIRLQRC